MSVITVRYYAGARAAAGVTSEDLELATGATVADVLALITERHGEALGKVLAACSFLLDSVAVRDHSAQVPPSAELDVLPPFAGG